MSEQVGLTSERIEILLVEDNPADLELTLGVFRMHDLTNHIQVARDGAEALDFLFCRGTFAGRQRGDTPKAILLDLKLPKIDGLDVLRPIRKDENTRAIPVVVMKSSREERDIVESYNLGSISYIVNPVDFEQFSNAVQHIGYDWLLLNQARRMPDRCSPERWSE